MLAKRIGREVRVTIRRGDEFRASLRIRVRIVTAHWLVLAIAPQPFTILVALVARHVYDYALTSQGADGFKQVNGAHDIGSVIFKGVLIADADDRLRREVKDDFGLEFCDGSFQAIVITYVCEYGAQT